MQHITGKQHLQPWADLEQLPGAGCCLVPSKRFSPTGCKPFPCRSTPRTAATAMAGRSLPERRTLEHAIHLRKAAVAEGHPLLWTFMQYITGEQHIQPCAHLEQLPGAGCCLVSGGCQRKKSLLVLYLFIHCVEVQ
jgi:hypothetical protein